MQMMQILWPGAIAVQTIHVAAKLALADLVAGGPKSITELADSTHTHGPSMARLMRALTSLGIFVEDTTGRYRQTALSDTLRSDHPESIRPSAKAEHGDRADSETPRRLPRIEPMHWPGRVVKPPFSVRQIVAGPRATVPGPDSSGVADKPVTDDLGHKRLRRQR